MNTHKVIWREGMLLRPQHFQHNDRYYDHQMKTRTQLLGRFTWGFLGLVIDQQTLSTSKLAINEASGIFPDGSLFELGGQGGKPLMLDIPPNTSNTSVYLALPVVTGNHIEARQDADSDVLARYAIYDADIDDSNAGEGIRSMLQCGRPDFRLLLGEQQSDSTFVKLKVCEITSCTADHGVVLNTDYVPTVIHTEASTALTGHLNEVITLVGTRAGALAERISSSGQSGGSEFGNFMMLQLMNRTQMELIHYKGLHQVHPEELYRLLLALIGDLSTFASANRRPLLEFQYKHSDQGTCFLALIVEFRLLMSMVLEEHATKLPLTQHPYGIQVAMVADHQHFNTSSFVLVAGASCGVEVLRNQLPSQIKVGTVETISDLVNRHLPGFRIRPMAVAPREIAFHSDKAYFVLDLDADNLAKLKASGGFAFHVSGDMPGLDLKFWAIKK